MPISQDNHGVRKPSLKMKRTALILAQNPRKSMGAAMVEAGYSKHTANRPSDVTTSMAWRVLMDQYLPDEYIVAKHLELSEASKLEHLSVPFGGESMPSLDEVRQLVEVIPSAVYLGHSVAEAFGQRQLRIIYLAPDYRSRKDAIDLAYRLRGRFESAKREQTKDLHFSLSELRKMEAGE